MDFIHVRVYLKLKKKLLKHVKYSYFKKKKTLFQYL